MPGTGAGRVSNELEASEENLTVRTLMHTASKAMPMEAAVLFMSLKEALE